MAFGCDRYGPLLSRYLDNAVDDRGRKEVIAHLDQCPACARALAQLRQQRVRWQRLPTTTPSAAVRYRILASTEPSARRWRSRTLLRSPAVLAFAALVALVPPGWAVSSQIRGSANPMPLATNRPVAVLFQDGSGVNLPRYLPPGTAIERVWLERDAVSGGIVGLEVVLIGRNGERIHLVQRRAPSFEFASSMTTDRSRSTVVAAPAAMPKRVLELRRGSLLILVEGNGSIEELEAIARVIQ